MVLVLVCTYKPGIVELFMSHFQSGGLFYNHGCLSFLCLDFTVEAGISCNPGTVDLLYVVFSL